MNELIQMSSEFGKMLQLVATQAGLVLQQLWIILVRQQIILGAQEFIKGLAEVIAGIAIYKIMTGKIKTAVADKSEDGLTAQDGLFTAAFVFLVAIVVVIWGADKMIASLPQLFNPQYNAIHEAVQILKEVKK